MIYRNNYYFIIRAKLNNKQTYYCVIAGELSRGNVPYIIPIPRSHMTSNTSILRANGTTADNTFE